MTEGQTTLKPNKKIKVSASVCLMLTLFMMIIWAGATSDLLWNGLGSITYYIIGWLYLTCIVRMLVKLLRRTITTENYDSSASLLSISVAMIAIPTLFFGLLLYGWMNDPY